MKKILFGFICLLFVMPTFVVRAATVDVGIKPYSIKFSKSADDFISGETIRVYVSAVNYGGDDANGNIIIYRDNQVIGDKPISLIAGSIEDEVFADFVVPEHPFRMFFELKGVTPEDTNSSNNQVLSPLYEVDIDTDKDGLSNSDDTDDDNDGLLDYEEDRIGTDYLNYDTDGDGVSDKDDAFPLDPTKFKKEEPIPAEQPKVEPKTESVATAQIKDEDVKEEIVQVQDNDVVNEEAEALGKEELVGDFYQSAEVTLLNEIHIKAHQVNWNTFDFSFTTNLDGLDLNNLEYVWVYGDGQEGTENGHHRYNKTGDYYVTLKVKGPWQSYYYDNAKVTVNFWSVYNYWLWLIVLAGSLVLVLFGAGFKHRPKTITETEYNDANLGVKSIANRKKKQPKQKIKKEE